MPSKKVMDNWGYDMAQRVCMAIASGTDILTAGISCCECNVHFAPIKSKGFGACKYIYFFSHVCLLKKYDLGGHTLIDLSLIINTWAGPLKMNKVGIW